MAEMHTVTVAPEGSTFTSPADRSILHGMEFSCGHGIQVGCRSGGCGVCRVRVIAGTYTTKRMSRAFITDDDLAVGIVLSCRTYPTADLTVERCPKPAASASSATASPVATPAPPSPPLRQPRTDTTTH